MQFVRTAIILSSPHFVKEPRIIWGGGAPADVATKSDISINYYARIETIRRPTVRHQARIDLNQAPQHLHASPPPSTHRPNPYTSPPTSTVYDNRLQFNNVHQNRNPSPPTQTHKAANIEQPTSSTTATTTPTTTDNIPRRTNDDFFGTVTTTYCSYDAVDRASPDREIW